MLFTVVNVSQAAFLLTKTFQISKLEIWPSASGTSKYGTYLIAPISETGCEVNHIFYREAGPALIWHILLYWQLD